MPEIALYAVVVTIHGVTVLWVFVVFAGLVLKKVPTVFANEVLAVIMGLPPLVLVEEAPPEATV